MSDERAEDPMSHDLQTAEPHISRQPREGSPHSLSARLDKIAPLRPGRKPWREGLAASSGLLSDLPPRWSGRPQGSHLVHMSEYR